MNPNAYGLSVYLPVDYFRLRMVQSHPVVSLIVVFTEVNDQAVEASMQFLESEVSGK